MVNSNTFREYVLKTIRWADGQAYYDRTVKGQGNIMGPVQSFASLPINSHLINTPGKDIRD